MRSEITLDLCKFIKYNTSLQHLSLSSTGLDFEMIKALADGAITKARSLLSLHLSDNPGITPDNIAFLKTRIKAQKGAPVPIQIPDSCFLQTDHDQSRSNKVQDFLKLKQIKKSFKSHDHTLKVKAIAS